MSSTASILLVGLGGAGCSIVARLAPSLPAQVRAVLLDADLNALQNSAVAETLQLGRSLTRGMGTGGESALGLAAIESEEPALRRLFTGVPIVVLVTGLGGGLGSGAAPALATIATEAGSTVLAFATIPFSHEGERRKRLASDALEKLSAKAHGLVVVQNDLLSLQVSADASLAEAFAAADDWVAGALRALASIFEAGALVPVDPAALRSILAHPGSPTLFTSGKAQGPQAALLAARAATESALAHGPDVISKVASLFVSVTGGSALSASDAFEAVNIIRAKFGGETTTIVGARIKPELGDGVEVAVIGASAPAPKAPKTRKTAKAGDPNQALFGFATEESLRRGIFGSAPFTFVDGVDIDVPTYIRRSIRLSPPK